MITTQDRTRLWKKSAKYTCRKLWLTCIRANQCCGAVELTLLDLALKDTCDKPENTKYAAENTKYVA